jgi:general stress protein YciG
MSQNSNNKNDKRGLQAADEETIKRVARKGGKA